MEMVFTPSSIVGKVGIKISLEPLKLTLRRRGSVKPDSPEVFILPNIQRGIISDDQALALQETSHFVANTAWMDVDTLLTRSIKDAPSETTCAWVEVSSGNVEDGDMCENERILVPNVLLLCEEPTQKKMSKKDSERLLQELKDIFVFAGMPSSMGNKSTSTTMKGEKDTEGWVKGQSLSISPPMFSNGKGVTVNFNDSKTSTDEEEDNDETPSTQHVKVVCSACVDFELFSSKMSSNTPSYPISTNSQSQPGSSGGGGTSRKKVSSNKRNCLEIDTSITESEVKADTATSTSKSKGKGKSSQSKAVLLPLKDVSANQPGADKVREGEMYCCLVFVYTLKIEFLTPVSVCFLSLSCSFFLTFFFLIPYFSSFSPRKRARLHPRARK